MELQRHRVVQVDGVSLVGVLDDEVEVVADTVR